MSYDIYGNPLRHGHCEVHPHVHEEYPCSVCVAESRRQKEVQIPAQCDGNPTHCESAHYLGQAQEEIKRLNDEIQALRNDAERYRYLKKGNQWIVAATQTGFHVDGGDLDELIDGDIKQARRTCYDKQIQNPSVS